MPAPKQLAKETPNSWIPQQFNNPANPEIHRKTTAEEIWEDTDGKMDILVAAVGTGGTITGCVEVIKPKQAVIPGHRGRAEGFTGHFADAGRPAGQARSAQDSRHGRGFCSEQSAFEGRSGNPQIVECVQVSNDDAFAMARRLAKEEGILCGISTGANVVGAIEVAKRPENKGKLIVTIACSTGERYLSTPLAAEARAEVGG